MKLPWENKDFKPLDPKEIVFDETAESYDIPIEKILEEYDIKMKDLFIKVTSYPKNSDGYIEMLNALNIFYESFNKILPLYDGTYLLKYSNMSEIEKLLVATGYIEKPKSK